MNSSAEDAAPEPYGAGYRRAVGHTAGKCATTSGDATGGDTLCQDTFDIDGGQPTIRGLFDRADPSGTGADSNFVLHVITG